MGRQVLLEQAKPGMIRFLIIHLILGKGMRTWLGGLPAILIYLSSSPATAQKQHELPAIRADVAKCRPDAKSRYGRGPDVYWGDLQSLKSSISRRWWNAESHNNRLNELRAEGKCTLQAARPPEPRAKKCTPESINKEKVACFALVWGKDECVDAVGEQNPALASSFSGRAALAVACDAGIHSRFARRYLPADAIKTVFDESLSAGCRGISDDNILSRLFGIAACTTHAANVAMQIDAANWCARRAEHHCDESYLQWMDTEIPDWERQAQQNVECEKHRQEVLWNAHVGLCECGVLRKWLRDRQTYWKNQGNPMCGQFESCVTTKNCSDIINPNR